MGRDRRGHRHGGWRAGPPAGPLRPPGAVRREGALDAARRARGRFALRCRNWPSRWPPDLQRPTTTHWHGPDAQPTRSKTSAAASRRDSCRSSAAEQGGSSALYGMVCERFFVDDFTPRQNFTAPGDSTVPDEWPVTYDQMRALVRGGGKAAEGSRPARSPAAGGGRRRICLRRRRFRRQSAAGRLSRRSRIASLSPADGLRLHAGLHHLSDLSLRPVVQERCRPQLCAAGRHRARCSPVDRMPSRAPRRGPHRRSGR